MMSAQPAANVSKSQSASPQASPLATPNLYQLSGGGIQLTYRTEGTLAPSLTYQDAHQTLSFHSDQVRIVAVPDLGTLVSVTLHLSPDAGSTSFTLFVPNVSLSNLVGASLHIQTEGVTTLHRLSLAPQLNLGQTDHYRIVTLSGTAMRGIVPL